VHIRTEGYCLATFVVQVALEIDLVEVYIEMARRQGLHPRQDMIDWLSERECTHRGAAVIYLTHAIRQAHRRTHVVSIYH